MPLGGLPLAAVTLRIFSVYKLCSLGMAAISFFGVSGQFAQFFGGTSLLILVGVVLDTLQQIESHLLMRHYDGLLKSGKIKGRTGSIAAY